MTVLKSLPGRTKCRDSLFYFPAMMDDIIKSALISAQYGNNLDADYVMIVDSDEFIFPYYVSTTVKEHLKSTHIDVYFVNLWQIFKHETDQPLDQLIPVCLQRRHGDPNMSKPDNIGYLKPMVVRCGLDIFWGIGNHYVVCNKTMLESNTRLLSLELPISVAVDEIVQEY